MGLENETHVTIRNYTLMNIREKDTLDLDTTWLDSPVPWHRNELWEDCVITNRKGRHDGKGDHDIMKPIDPHIL